MKKTLLVAICATGLLATSSAADIFDGSKEGFLLGFGVGGTYVSTDVDFKNGARLDDKRAGIATSFKLGYGFNEQFALYYTNQVDWYKFKGDGTIVGLTGIGVDYYLGAGSPYYATGMIGVGTISDIKDKSISRGWAYQVGLGYEVAPHMTIEASYMKINIDEKIANVDTDSIRVTFNYTLF